MESKDIKTTTKGKVLAGAIVIILVVLCCLVFKGYNDRRTYVTTDNVKVTGDIFLAKPRIAGRIAIIKVKEGDLVKKGEVLFTLETDVLAAKVKQAKATLEIAQAHFNKAVGGARSQEITGAQSLVDQANAAYNGALVGKESLKKSLLKAQNTYRSLTSQMEDFKNPKTKELELNYAMKQLNIMYVRKKIADAQYTVQAQGILQMFISKTQLEEQITQMKDQIKGLNASLESSKAGLTGAASRLKLVAEGASTKDIAILVNTVKAAQASLELARLSLSFASVKAQSDGTVVQITAHMGDIVSQGFSVMSIVDFSKLRARACIHEKDLENVKAGQQVKLSLDAFPGKSFEGKISKVGLTTASVLKSFESDKYFSSYTKVCERVPVTIEFNYRGIHIIPGMSASAEIRIAK